MNILVINSGSSSIKYQLFDMSDERTLAEGVVEKIGEQTGALTHEAYGSGEKAEIVEERAFRDHHEGLVRIGELLGGPETAALGGAADIAAVGHRVVHGGETFQDPTIIDDRVMEVIRENIPLAPLHNPPNLLGIEVAMAIFPGATQVAVFDTAFHQTLPMAAFLYALPFELYEKHRVRRYGFHGTSHAYVCERASAYLKRPLDGLRLISLHLGNGASMAAVKNGKCIDTTMGMTPLGGLVMGTRSGDVDPALPFFLADHLNMSLGDIDRLLNRESGLKGICGSNDMRDVIDMAEAGNERAAIALDVYIYRIRKFIGAYAAALEGLDALIFTAGVGENAPYIRRRCCEGLAHLGIAPDRARNAGNKPGISEISAGDSRVKVLVVPTDEELRIAQETERVIRK
ncbi:MAG: acetate kinase [Deltaproteobacteria bacterium]|nr:acetate kinase [Deltaproteobacteria bacterium]